MKVNVMWANLHTPEESAPMLETMARRAGECEAAGGRVQWLQSSTVVFSGQVQQVGSVGNTDIKCTPITALTCILTWKGAPPNEG